MTRCLCLKVLEVKKKVLVNFENPTELPPNAERVDCCRCVGGADELLELLRGVDDELVHIRTLG